MRWERLFSRLNYTEANVADGFAAEAMFKFSQDFRLGDLFDLVNAKH
jgi:hypothetical protein